jgi:hypothetical protein
MPEYAMPQWLREIITLAQKQGDINPNVVFEKNNNRIYGTAVNLAHTIVCISFPITSLHYLNNTDQSHMASCKENLPIQRRQ